MCRLAFRRSMYGWSLSRRVDGRGSGDAGPKGWIFRQRPSQKEKRKKERECSALELGWCSKTLHADNDRTRFWEGRSARRRRRLSICPRLLFSPFRRPAPTSKPRRSRAIFNYSNTQSSRVGTQSHHYDPGSAASLVTGCCLASAGSCWSAF